MIAGHTRCLVDGCFGLLKRKFRVSDCFTLDQLATVVNTSASCNIAQLYNNSGIMWRAWDDFLSIHLKPLVGISKLQHFSFDAHAPGLVSAKASIGGVEVQNMLLKTSKEALFESCLPPAIPAAGLSGERQMDLHKEI